MKKFNEVDKTSLYNKILARGITVDDSLKVTIDDWFNLREVVDDANFDTFFTRAFCDHYFRYVQLLRIEPNVSEYDWLVTKYRERLLQRVGEETKTASGSDALTHGMTTNTALESVRTPDLVKQASGTDTGTDRLVGTEDESITGTEDESITNVDTKQYTQSSQKDVSGSKTTTYNENQSTNQGVGSVTTAVTKSLPASSATNDDLQGVTVSSPNSRSFGAVKPSIVCATGENQSINQSYTDGETSHTGTVGDSNTELVTNSDSGSHTINNTNTKDLDTSKSRDLDTTATRTLNLANSNRETTTGTETIVNEGSITNSGTDRRATSASEEKGENVTDTEIYTGRDEAPAELLSQAVAYIKNTCAWDWFKDSLEPCFMCIYEL